MTLPAYLRPGADVEDRTRQMIVAVWGFCIAALWWYSPFIFWPSIPEVVKAAHDLWFNQNLAINFMGSIKLNVIAIIVSAVFSLSLAYAGTIALVRPVMTFVGRLRFLSFAGMGFAFTLMIGDGTYRKISVLVFMVSVYFVISMADVISQIPAEQYDLAHTLKMGPWETLWEVVIYGQIDQALLVLRQTSAMSWMFIGTAETLDMSGGGIGMMLENSNRHNHLNEVLALQMLVLVVGLLQDSMIGWLRTTCCPWVKTARNK